MCLGDFVVHSPPQRGDQFIQLVRDRLQFRLCRRIADGQAELADGVCVRAGAADGGAEVRAGDFAGRAGIALRALGAGVARVALRSLRAVGDGEGAVGSAVAQLDDAAAGAIVIDVGDGDAVGAVRPLRALGAYPASDGRRRCAERTR